MAETDGLKSSYSYQPEDGVLCTEESSSKVTAKGRVTGTRTHVLGDAERSFLKSYFYDQQGNIVQTHGANHLPGFDDEYYSYDHYMHHVKSRRHEQLWVQNILGTQPEVNSNSVTYTYDYDRQGRLDSVWCKINANRQGKHLIASYRYDELGRIEEEGMGNSALKTHYKYDLRSRVVQKSNCLTEQNVYYDINHGVSGIANSYNGNVHCYEWKRKDKNGNWQTESYTYEYDGRNWLTGAYSLSTDASGKSVGGLHDVNIEYDPMGNITHIACKGVNEDDGVEGYRDDASLSYDGNQLSGITSHGFTDSSQDMQVADEADLPGAEYAYDANGNMVRDANKGIQLVRYNALNLPEDIYSEDGNWHYSYDADGRKLAVYSVTLKTPITVPASQLMNRHFSAEELAESSRMMQRAYVGNYVYEFSAPNRGLVLTRLNLPCGYVSLPMRDAQYKYYVRDHLGNIRHVVDGMTGKVEQVSHYYPFGSLYGENLNQSPQRWRFGGKELDRTFDVCDFEARWYDPTTGRFMTMDEKSEKYADMTPYGYCGNDPIRKMDKDGREAGDFFKTPDAAAMDFGIFYNDNSIRENREYSSVIVAVANSEGKLGFTYLVPNVGNVSNTKLNVSVFGHTVVASIHSHGSLLTFDGKLYRPNEFSGSTFTRQGKVFPRQNLKIGIPPKTDIFSANFIKKDSYLVTPNGDLLKYDYEKGKIRKISNQMPTTGEENNPLTAKEKLGLYVKVTEMLLNKQLYHPKK